MGEPSLDTPPSEKLPEVLLDSWKEIAAYLKRDVTTVQRGEKREGSRSIGMANRAGAHTVLETIRRRNEKRRREIPKDQDACSVIGQLWTPSIFRLTSTTKLARRRCPTRPPSSSSMRPSGCR
jgi:hypothetical protein